jgi:hypothetical protein
MTSCCDNFGTCTCGPNAAWSETTHKGQIVCKTKHGHRTMTAQVTP